MPSCELHLILIVEQDVSAVVALTPLLPGPCVRAVSLETVQEKERAVDHAQPVVPWPMIQVVVAVPCPEALSRWQWPSGGAA